MRKCSNRRTKSGSKSLHCHLVYFECKLKRQFLHVVQALFAWRGPYNIYSIYTLYLDGFLIDWHVKEFARVLHNTSYCVLDSRRALLEGKDKRCDDLSYGGRVILDQPLTNNMTKYRYKYIRTSTSGKQ